MVMKFVRKFRTSFANFHVVLLDTARTLGKFANNTVFETVTNFLFSVFQADKIFKTHRVEQIHRGIMNFENEIKQNMTEILNLVF